MKIRVIAATACLAAFSAQAVPTTTVIGTVNVLGTDYSVSLLYDSLGDWYQQSFNALNPTITFITMADAAAAAQAMVDTFGAGFDWNPAADPDEKGTRVPYSSSAIYYEHMDLCCGTTDVYGPHSWSRDGRSTYSFAQFAPVPEPETYAMMALGLVVLSLARRRRQT